MTTQTIYGAEILMREYIKLGMKVGSRVMVAKKIDLRNIGWVDKMDKSIGSELIIEEILMENCSVILSDGWYYPIESLDLIIEPDEKPFEGTVPDGWELEITGAVLKPVLVQLLGVDMEDKVAWVKYNTRRTDILFSQLTLKRKK